MSLRYQAGIVTASYFPLKVPNAPTIGTASVASGTSVSVTFTAPSNVGGGAITSYVATARKTSDGTTVSGTGASSPITISGLTANSAYTVTVAAVNSFGAGPSSAASSSVTPQEQQLWVWGPNNIGQLGLNNITSYSSPKQVGAVTTWNKIGALGSSNGVGFAIRSNNSLWALGGWNLFGQLAVGNTTNYSSPKQIGSLTNWREISGSGTSAFGLKTDGTLWAWGYNGNGDLGINSTYNQSSPVQIGALTTWAKISKSTSLGFFLAITTSGTLYAWGANANGQLGLGDTTRRSSPVQVGALTTWLSVACGGYHTLAITTSGTLWAWGKNNNGQLGLGNATYYSSPKQIGALTNWAFVSGGNQFSVAVKTDGTLWTWGAGGALGLNNTTSYSSPKQVGALTNWRMAAAGITNTCLAIKTDGTLWSWGDNTQGQLGLGNTTAYRSPKQVGALTTWRDVVNTYSVYAIKTS